MYRVRRIRLENIGHKAAGFKSLVLDLTGGPSSLGGRPMPALDVILWLRNGGGKSSLMSLFFSLLLPRKDDFIGHKEDDKSLADYVPHGQVSHVIIEWEDSTQPGGGAALVTAGVYQWRDGQRPADVKSGWDRLERSWYVFRPQPGGLELDSLPLRSASGQLSRASFLRSLEAEYKENRRLRLVIAEGQYEWADQLTSHGLDPQIVKIQRNMNQDEGGITKLFKFPSCEAFLDFLIDMVVDERAPSAARSALDAHGNKLATRPARELENRFLAEALLRLRPVQEASRLLSETGFGLGHHIGLMDRAGEHVDARAAQLQSEARTSDAEATTARAEAEAAGQEAEESARQVVRWREAAAHTGLSERRKEMETCKREETGAEREHRAWEAVPLLLELAGLEQQLANTQQLLEQLSHKQAPLKEALRDAGAIWYARLCREMHRLAVQRVEAERRAQEADKQAQTFDEDRMRAAAAEGRAASRAEQAASRLQEIAVALTRGRADGLIGAAESPQDAVNRLTNEQQAVSEHRRKEAEHLEAAQALAREIAGAHSENARRLTRVREQHEELWERLDSLQQQRREVTSEPRLRELAQLDDSRGADLDMIGEDLLALLKAAVAEADARVAQEKAAALDDERARDALEREGYLPPARHVEEAVEALRALGASQAMSGARYLRDTVPADRHDEVIAAIPHLVSGVVVCGPVPGDDLYALARRARVALHSVIAVGTDGQARALAAGGGRCAVMPLHPAVLNAEAGEAELRRITDRLDGLEQRLGGIRERRDADRALAERLHAHLAAFGPGPRSKLEASLAGFDAEIDALTRSGSELSHRAKETAEAIEHAQRQISVSAERLLSLAGLLPRAQDLAQAARSTEQWEEQARMARAEAREQQAAVARLAAACQEARSRSTAARAEITMCKDTTRRWQREMQTLRQHIPDQALEDATAGEVPGGSLETLQHRWTQALTDWREGISDSALQQRLASCEKDVARVSKQLEKAEAVRERALELTEDADAADPQRRAERITAAQSAHDAARKGFARAELLLEQAQKAHAEAKSALDNLIPPAPRAAADSEDAARQHLFAAEQTDERARRMVPAKQLHAEQAERRAEQATGQAEQLAVSAAALRTAAARHRETLGVQRQEAPDSLTIDAVLEEAHGLSAATAPNLLPGTAREIASRLTEQAEASSRRHGQAAKGRDKAVRHVEHLATNPDYLGVVDGRLRDRLQQDLAMPKRLTELLEDLSQREQQVTALLAELADDQAKVVQTCASLVESVLDDLEEVSRHSTLPQQLGTWSGQRFLSLEIRHRAREEELQRRICAEVDLLTGALSADAAGKTGVLPEAMTLTKRLVLAALGGRGNVVAKIMKPGQNLDTVNRETVTEMRRFSGGELLTVSVLLYCTLAKMRTLKRDGTAIGGVGTLLLDNPFGKANYGPFLALQRRVAEAHGIQLLYTTGSNDLPALGRFPLVIRMRNGSDKRTRRRYVQIEETYGDAVSRAAATAQEDGITSAHLLRRPRTSQHGPAGTGEAR
ncbi:hypothetical protein [Streptomyces altiplanensis]